MRTWMKCYHVFLSQWWLKALVYILYPVVMIGGMCLAILIVKSQGAGITLAYNLTGNLFIMAELFLGYFIFGGVAAKDSNKLEYLKTSVRGMSVLKRGIIVDALRRALGIYLMLLVPLFICGGHLNSSIWVACAVVILCSEAGLIIFRRTSSFTIFIVVLVLSGTVGGAVMSIGMICSNFWWAVALFYVVTVAVTVCSIRMVMQKARESYYDAGFENKLEAA